MALCVFYVLQTQGNKNSLGSAHNSCATGDLHFYMRHSFQPAPAAQSPTASEAGLDDGSKMPFASGRPSSAAAGAQHAARSAFADSANGPSKGLDRPGSPSWYGAAFSACAHLCLRAESVGAGIALQAASCKIVLALNIQWQSQLLQIPYQLP